MFEAYGETLRWRSKAEVEALFAGLDLVEAGIVQIHKWRPAPGAAPIADSDIAVYGAVAAPPASAFG